jgi:hypothetical protein
MNNKFYIEIGLFDNYIETQTDHYKTLYDICNVEFQKIQGEIVSVKESAFNLPYISLGSKIKPSHEYYSRIHLKQEDISKNNLSYIMDEMISKMFEEVNGFKVIDIGFIDNNSHRALLESELGGYELRLRANLVKE